MYWIDDIVLMIPMFKRLLETLEKYLKQIQARNLRIDIQKCSFISDKATFCGRVLDGKCYSYDNSYATRLLGRVKP
eukprot:snap_masked-scaffold_30-processed-gene-2.41-mRNA-1 protein AED:1.00 eAED:1.00 QI:0/-1/0/0/-1/1/1/0/75